MDSPEGGNAKALERALSAEGVAGPIESRGRLAVLTPEPGTRFDARVRRRLVALAREHGFTNLAVELAPSDANLSGD
jgi:hypothetical protein